MRSAIPISPTLWNTMEAELREIFTIARASIERERRGVFREIYRELPARNDDVVQ